MIRKYCTLVLAALLAFVAANPVVEEEKPFEDTGMHCKGGGITDLMQWDHAQCAGYCNVREDCDGYVFNIKSNFSCILKGSTCQMKSSDTWRFYKKPGASANLPGSNSDWNSDPAPVGMEPVFGGVENDVSEVVNGPPGNAGDSFSKQDFHCAGRNLGNGEPWSLGECAAQCMRNDKCIGFVRLITGDQQCILKEAGCTKKPPTVWVFYEKTTNGEIWPEGSAAVAAGTVSNMAPESDRPSSGHVSSDVPVSPVAADTPLGGYGAQDKPEIDSKHFSDTTQHCKGGVISNEMHGHDQCSRACLDAPDCIGYSISKRDPFQCYMKSKECEPIGSHEIWTFIKKNDELALSQASSQAAVPPPPDSQPSTQEQNYVDPPQLQQSVISSVSSEDNIFREMRAVRCIKFAEEYGATSAEQCKQMCLDRETFCVGVSFRTGSCKLITSFDCGGWQIFKKSDLPNPADPTVDVQKPSDPYGAPEWPAYPEPAGMPNPLDFAQPFNNVPDAGMMGSMALNDVLPGASKDEVDVLMYYHKLNGNCRGGNYLGDVWGTEADCATKCDKNVRCRGFSYIKSEGRCTMKADACHTPNVVNPNVSYWAHLQRQQ